MVYLFAASGKKSVPFTQFLTAEFHRVTAEFLGVFFSFKEFATCGGERLGTAEI
jgi:hypothetical protein